MNYLFAIISAFTGIACFIWYKPLYKTYAKFMTDRFHSQFGGLAHTMKWDDPNNRGQLMIYKSGIIGIGLFFMAVAFYLAFGTVNIGT